MTRTLIYVSCGEGREIDVFSLTDHGDVCWRQRVPTASMSVPMRVRAESGRLYAGMREANRLAVYAIAAESGELSLLGEVATPGAPVYVFCDRDLRVAFCPSYSDNNLSVFPLDAQGIPLAASQVLHNLPRAHAARLDASGRWLLVPMLGADGIRIYRLKDDLHLEPNDLPIILGRPGSGPRHPVFSSDNRFVYCLNELDGSIDVFAFDDTRGALLLEQTISIMPEGFVAAPWTAELRLTPDGRHLYASDRRSSTVAALVVDKQSGRLTLVDHFSTENQPRGMDIDPSGKWLVVAGQQSAHLSVYAIDPISGRLSLRRRHETGRDPICVEIAVI